MKTTNPQNGCVSRAAFPSACVVMAWVLAGCSTPRPPSPSQYTSPRVEGRVLDSQTCQPLAEVVVRRFNPNEDANADKSAHGAEGLRTAPFTRSRADGTFALESERDLALLRKLGWSSVSIACELRGYERFTATYTLTNATKSAKGEPMVQTGDILLPPLAR